MAENIGLDENREELLIERVFDAPVELMWKMWTDPEHLKHWWGPKGFGIRTLRMELKPGGTFLYGMTPPKSFEMFGKFVFWDIAEPDRLEFIVSFCDKDANILRHPMTETWPLEVMNILSFSSENGKTKLTMRAFPIRATEEEAVAFTNAHKSVQQGFKGTMEQLENYLTQIQL